MAYYLMLHQSNIMTMKFLKQYFIPLLFLFTAIYVSLFDVEKPEIFIHMNYGDKILHFLMYMSMTFLLLIHNFLRTKDKSPVRIFKISSFIFLISFVLETGQAILTTHRSFELLDLAGNLTGIVSSVILFYSLTPLFTKRAAGQPA